ncbi:hypothetical protein, partial [Streptomyces beijiangensis]
GSSPQHAQGEARATAPTPAVASVTPKGPVNTGSRLALRNWRISTRLVALLTLPVVAATTLGGMRINESLD